MQDKLTKLGSGAEGQDINSPKERPSATPEGKEILETKSSVSEGVNVLSEDSEEGGVFSEDEKKAKDDGGQAKSGGSQAQAKVPVQVKALPAVDVMIKETAAAIEAELKTTEDEIKVMRRNKDVSAFDLNEKVKRMRFLNSLLSELKRAAKMAEDYVIGLWKQFVGKSN